MNVFNIGVVVNETCTLRTFKTNISIGLSNCWLQESSLSRAPNWNPASASYRRPASRALGAHWLGDPQLKRGKPASYIPMAQGPIRRQLLEDPIGLDTSQSNASARRFQRTCKDKISRPNCSIGWPDPSRPLRSRPPPPVQASIHFVQ